jgi:hypothetical protein
VLSEEIILLIRLREPALELCRLTNIGRPDGMLETVCVLSLPELTMSTSLLWATCAGKHPGHALFSKSRRALAPDSVGVPVLSSTFLSTRHTPPAEGWGPGRQLRSVPADGIVSVVMYVRGLSGYSRMIDLCMRCRSLLAFANYKPAHAGTGMGTEAKAIACERERDREEEGERGEGYVPVVPWEEWGPKNTRVLEHELHTWGSLVGERRATVEQIRPTRITIRDYNPFRVRRARVRTGGAGNEIKLECGSVMRVVDEISTYRGGEWFVDDIESSLPYVETVTPYEGCEGIFMDEDTLLAEVRSEVSVAKYTHTWDYLALTFGWGSFQAGERKFLLHRL